jgi:glutathione peroxidase
MNTVYDFKPQRLTGEPDDLNAYRGKVLLIVNTASKCGLTPQYKALESIYQQYRDKGFEVLGFPCNQFGAQEPGDAQQIGEFCEKNYGVSFPLFAKIDVNGDTAHPLFKLLQKESPGTAAGEPVKWNFTKFLVKKNGALYKRYEPQTEPKELIDDIKMLLAE